MPPYDGPHSDGIHSGSKHNQFHSPRALIGSNQLWFVNDSPYYQELEKYILDAISQGSLKMHWSS